MENFSDIITSPSLAFTAILVLWWFLYLSLIKFGKLSNSKWIKIEFIWIGAGIFGVLLLVVDTRNIFNENRLLKVNNYIRVDTKRTLDYATNQMHCFKYIDSGIFSPIEYDRITSRLDSICIWTKEVAIVIESSINHDYSKIDSIPKLLVSKKDDEQAYHRFPKEIAVINNYIIERNKLRDMLKDKSWSGAKHSFGILLLIVVFALKLTVTTKKIIDSKKSNK